ncbi:MAG: hypothetical protein HY703_09795 [Gemmatimonadetes bacterium]|nr:hypothetical protein [Gemmatimonadota bacterium]
MRARTLWLPLLALALAAGAPAARAQVPGVNLQVVPKIGAYLPVSDLAELRDTVSAEMEAGLAIGLALELNLPLSPINIRGNLEYATDSKVSAEGVRQGDEAETTLLALVGDIVYRPLPRIIVVQPYVLAGAGVKRYDFDEEDLRQAGEDLRNAFPEDATDFTLHLGAGLDVKLGPIALLVEVSDYISWFKRESSGAGSGDGSEIQNDVFGMVGFRVGLF